LKGLDKIENYNKLRILYWMDRLADSDREILKVHPQNNKKNIKRGVFSTHSPVRPNPIGVSTVNLIKRENNILIVKGLDALNNSPLIDIKSN
jgi:tRNA-Thr(GGU) m(6)t(6)A37 methyltransferase TsaA